MPSLPKCDRCKIILKDTPITKVLKNDLAVDSILNDGVYVTAKLCRDCINDLEGIDEISALPAGDIHRYRYNKLWFD